MQFASRAIREQHLTRHRPHVPHCRLQTNDMPASAALAYAGRPVSASPAVGYLSKHNAQQRKLIEDAFGDTLADGEMLVRT